jgi:dihydroorotate dehydrogenase
MGRIIEASYALLRPILFSIDAERSHRLTLQMLARMPSIAPASDPPELRCTVFGVSFSNPLGLAAGADKDARAISAWNSLGFGFAEIATSAAWKFAAADVANSRTARADQPSGFSQ